MSWHHTTKPPTNPPPTQPIPQKITRVSVFAAEGGFAPVISGILTFDDPTWAVVLGFVEGGRLRFDLPASAVWGWQITLTVRTADQSATFRETLMPDIDVGLPPRFVPLPRLVPNGEFLQLENGTPFTIIQCSDFNLFNRFLTERADAIRPVLQQRKDSGFNYLRVWTAYNIDRIGRLIPREHLNYYTQVSSFLRLAATYGLYVELTAGTGPWGGVFDLDDEKVWHWQGLIAGVMGETNVSLELLNEADNGPNRPWPIDRCVRPVGILASHGSNSIDADPVLPVWDLAGFHPGPDPRKVGHNAMERADLFHLPIWSGETVRYPDNAASPLLARDAARAAALLCAGSCFHSVHGKLGQLWDGVELDCAKAWASGAKEVPLEFQRGFYTHETGQEGPEIVRAYSRTLPEGRKYFARIHAS